MTKYNLYVDGNHLMNGSGVTSNEWYFQTKAVAGVGAGAGLEGGASFKGSYSNHAHFLSWLEDIIIKVYLCPFYLWLLLSVWITSHRL